MRFRPIPATRVALLLGAVLLATTVAPRALFAQSNLRMGIYGYPGTLSLDSLASSVQIPATSSETFGAVAKVFEELKMSMDVRDSARGVVGASNVPTMKRFANQRLSQTFNCGRSMTGMNADSWRVYVTVLAFVQPGDEGHVTLKIAVVGGAQDVAGTSTEPVACASTGKLEKTMFDRVLELTAGATSP